MGLDSAPDLFLKIARTYARHGRPALAVPLFRALAQTDMYREEGSVPFHWAECLVAMDEDGNREEALVLLQRSLELAPRLTGEQTTCIACLLSLCSANAV